MAKAVRVDKIVTLQSGEIEVTYAFGDPPLAARSTASVRYQSKQQILDELIALGNEIDEKMLFTLLLAITYVGQNGALKNETSVIGKMLTFDPTAANPMRLQ